MGRWTSKPWFIHTVEYYPAMKSNKLHIHTTTWMNLKCMTLSERSQTPDYVTPLMGHLEKGHMIGQNTDWWFQEWGGARL